MGKHIGKDRTFGGETIDVGTCIELRVVGAQEVGPQRVDGNQKDFVDRCHRWFRIRIRASTDNDKNGSEKE